MTKYILSVNGMMCQSCEKHAVNAVKAVAKNALDNPQYPPASLLSVIDKQYLEA